MVGGVKLTMTHLVVVITMLHMTFIHTLVVLHMMMTMLNFDIFLFIIIASLSFLICKLRLMASRWDLIP
jgi:hypothetical protein